MNFSDLLYNLLSYSKDAFLLLALLASMYLLITFFTSVAGPLA